MSNYPTPFDAGKILFEIGKSLFTETDLGKLLPLAMDKVIEQTKAQRGMIIVYGPHGEPLVEVARDHHQKDIDQPEKEISTTIAQRVRESGRYVVIKNAVEDPSFDKSLSVSTLRILSVAGAPLRHEGEVLGVIYIDNRDVRAVFDDETGKLLSEFAELISVAVKNALDWRKLQESQRELQDALEGYGEMIGRSPAIKEVFRLIDKVAMPDIPVLITGETGTGKELVARALHRRSSRCAREMIKFNCATLQSGLAGSMLFGHKKGAFTDAKEDKAGLFEAAHQSTIFLDEVGEIPLPQQPQLLRVLQDGESMRLGENLPRQVNVRVIAATNRHLEDLIKHGQFRDDLFYRLKGIEIELPPLRERGEDIMLIAQSFVRRFAKQFNRPVFGISKAAEELIRRHPFPGNVRELENMIQSAVFLSEGAELQPKDLPSSMRDHDSPAPEVESTEEKKYSLSKLKWERDFLCARLREAKGNVALAARLAGMHKKNFYQKMQQHGLKREGFV